MSNWDLGDTKKDIICLFLLLNKNSLPRTLIAGILKSSHQTIKKYANELIKEGYLVEDYNKNRVWYTLNRNKNEISKIFQEYCRRHRERLELLIDKYNTIKGIDQSTQPFETSIKLKSHVDLNKPQRDYEYKYIHRKVQEIIAKLGMLLGYSTEREYVALKCGESRFDVVWYTEDIVKKVFEIQFYGDLKSALVNLNCALESYNAQPILIIFDREIHQKALKLLRNATFKKLKKRIMIIDGNPLLKLDLDDKLISTLKMILED